jgi:hypothetical protein
MTSLRRGGERMRRCERVRQRHHHATRLRQQPGDGLARLQRAADERAAVEVKHQRRRAVACAPAVDSRGQRLPRRERDLLRDPTAARSGNRLRGG